MFQISLALLSVHEQVRTWELCSVLSVAVLTVLEVLAVLALPVLEPVLRPEVVPQQAQLGWERDKKWIRLQREERWEAREQPEWPPVC
ncbi:hypothetical protein DPMN_027989 [Dreissena polymorpha]|uniref:Uncharacterized protein n=1 Tax=Dreissena polymorpha TaxID=45954 RepID=A0A9D4LY46_DREPO|nr:hypothetical protein DPMN_027989 [Dreissena polymorpha]